MKYCSKNHENPDDATFCHECGEKLTIKTKSGKKTCPICLEENPKDAHYCHSCGADLSPLNKPTTIKEEKKEKKKEEKTVTTSPSNNDEPLPYGCCAVLILPAVIAWLASDSMSDFLGTSGIKIIIPMFIIGIMLLIDRLFK